MLENTANIFRMKGQNLEFHPSTHSKPIMSLYSVKETATEKIYFCLQPQNNEKSSQHKKAPQESTVQ